MKLVKQKKGAWLQHQAPFLHNQVSINNQKVIFPRYTT